MKGKQGKFRWLVAILLATIVFSNLGITKVSAKSNFDVSTELGIDSKYTMGEGVPFNITIQNNDSNFDGEVQLLETNYNNHAMAYSKKLNLAAGAKKTVRIFAPLHNQSINIEVRLVQKDKVIYSTNSTLSASNASSLVGVLSDDFDGVSYIAKTMSSSASKMLVARLRDEDIAEGEANFKMFNTILINNFDTSKMSKTTYEALKKWVYEGGVLVVGTGENYKKTLGIFKDDFVQGDIGSISSVTTNHINSMVEGKNSNLNMTLDVLDLKVKNSTTFLGDDKLPLISGVKAQQGFVAIAKFDFSNKALSGWLLNGMFAEKFLLGLSSQSSRVVVEGNPWATIEALSSTPEIATPSTLQFVILFLVYLIIVGPLNYLILKLKDKREYMWFTVPAISVVFGLIMFVGGFSVRVREKIYNVISVVKIGTDNKMSVSTKGGILSPSSTKMTVTADSEVALKPLAGLDSNNYGQPVKNVMMGDAIVDSKYAEDEKKSVSFYSNSATINYVDLGSYYGKNQGMENNLLISNSTLKGDLKNLTGFDLEDCHLIYENSDIKIGDMKDKEKKSLSENIGKSYGNNNIFDTIYRGHMYGSTINKSASELQKLRENMQKNNVLNANFMSRNGVVAANNILIGWTKNPVAKDIYVDGKKVKKIEKSLVVVYLSIGYESGTTADIPFEKIVPIVSKRSDKIDIYFNGKDTSMYGSGDAELKYDIDSKINVDNLEVKFSNGAADGAKKYIFNTSTMQWEEKSQNLSVSGKDVSKYVDSNNKVTIRIESTQEKGGTYVPQIAVKGKVK